MTHQQYYQIVTNVNNGDDLKRLIPNLNLDNVQLIQMGDDNQQFLIQDDSYVINDNKQVQQMVYQQQQHQPQQQAQQHQQPVQTHHQQQTHQYVIQDDDNIVANPQQQLHHQQQQQHHIQQAHHPQQIYYATETNQLVQGSMIQHTQSASVQNQQQQPTQQQQQQVIYQPVQAQHQPQHHQQIILQKSPDGTIRQTTMQPQQVLATPPNQGGHLILQQSSTNPTEHILVQQSPQQHAISQTHQLTHQQIVRPQQRIVYKTQNPIVYQPPSLQQQQQQQPQQIPTTTVTNQQRLIQQRTLNQQQQQQTSQTQNIVFHPVQQKPNQTNSITYQQQPQQQVQTNQTLRMTNTNIIRSPGNRIIMNPTHMVRVPSPRTPGIRQQLRNNVPLTTQPNIVQPRAQRPRSLTPRGGGRGRGARNLTPGQVRMTTTTTSTVASPKLTQIRQVSQTISPNQSPQHSQQINQIVQQNSTAPNIPQKSFSTNAPGQRFIYATKPAGQQQAGATQVIQQHQQQQEQQENSSLVPTSSTPNTRPVRMPTKIMSTGNQLNQSDDIEDSIQAVFVSKPTDQKASTSDNQIQQNVNSLGQKFDTTLTAYYADSSDDKKLKKTIALAEYKRTQQKQQNPVCKNFGNMRMVNSQQQGIPVNRVAPMIQQQQSTQPKPQLTSNPELVIQTQQIIQNRIQNPQTLSDGVERGNAKMLVILASGEQRLITFTLPKDSCTVQELLEQVNVPFDSSTTIQCVSSQGANIDYVVTVGIPLPSPEARAEWITNAEQSLITIKPSENVPPQHQQQHQQPHQHNSSNQQQQIQQNHQHASTPTSTTNDGEKIVASDTVPPKIIKGYLAVCEYCGVCGIDHAKCDRCKRVFLEEPKRVPNKASCIKNDDKRSSLPNEMINRVQTKVMPSLGTPMRGRGGSYTISGRGRGGRGGMSRAARQAEAEPVILTLSSDDEVDDEKSANSSQNSSIDTSTKIEKPLACEPVISDIDGFQSNDNSVRENVADLTNFPDKCFTNLTCKLIRIGTFRFEPKEKVVITAKGIRIVAPSCSNPDENICLDILEHEILKLVVHWIKPLPIIFVYVMPKCGTYIRESIDMKQKTTTNDSPYFNPLDRTDAYRRIVLQMDIITEESRSVIKSIFSTMKLEQINIEDANELLHRASAKDNLLKMKESESEQNIRRILIYPQGKGGISINTEDYMCLAIDQYLNDVIIDFYLKFIHLGLPIEQRNKYHIFSSFFYKRLTTMTTRQRQNKDDIKLTAAQKRHARVASWTKNVNLFEKDFIIIPINEQSHWFLAIICFPMLKSPVTFDTLQPVVQQQVVKKKKAVGERKISLQIGNTTITPLSKRELEAVCVGDDESERDEAEGDDSDLASDDSDTESTASINNSTPTTSTQKAQSQSIKQPLILIFDSLSSGAARSRVVATLRDYLTCEYRAKIREPYVFNKTNMPGHCVKVPQQNNFTDCGLYVLQYVEQFINDPIKDYKIPIKQLINWFETIVVTRKREEISNLLKELVSKQHPERLPLPEIQFPTLDGKLIEPEYTDEQAEFEEEEMDEEFEEEEDDAQNDDQKLKTNGANTQEIVRKRTIGEIASCNKLNEPAPRKLKIDESSE